MSTRTSFIVFADDWGRHPSSCQHLFRRLIPQHRTFWVNTIGLRRPRFDLASIKRALEKLRHWTQRNSAETTPLPANLSVSNPRMWPWFSTGLDRALNRWLLVRHLRRLAAPLSAPPVVVSTLPIVADLVESFPNWRWVYYCVDDFGEWPGVDGRAMQRMEAKFVRACHRIIAVSETLRTRLAGMGRSSELLTHGVDLDYWRKSAEAPALVEVRDLPRPLIVFWGVVDRRMDAAWVKALAGSLTTGTVLLVGPKDDPEPTMMQSQNVVYLPSLPYDHLLSLAREAAVLIMPYADLPVTRAMQPLKLKEYLATGKPAVVRDLPANRDWADCMDMVATRESLINAVHTRLQTGVPPEQQQARGRLAAEGWERKAQLFENWILEGMKG
jgi:glycosyltransferase involved in cell wall biosynthesis